MYGIYIFSVFDLTDDSVNPGVERVFCWIVRVDGGGGRVLVRKARREGAPRLIYLPVSVLYQGTYLLRTRTLLDNQDYGTCKNYICAHLVTIHGVG